MKPEFIQANSERLPFADNTFDFVFGSPPYCDARTYGIGAQRKCQAWVDWMQVITAEAVRVSKGLVIWICAGVTRDWCYQPGPEGLLYEWWKAGGRCWRPAYWHRVGIPGSGGKQWLRADVEYALCFTKCTAAVPFADNTANGHPPKWNPGGEISHRAKDGKRVNALTGKLIGEHFRMRPDGYHDVAPPKTTKDAMGFHKYGGRGKDANGNAKTPRGRHISRGHDADGVPIVEEAYIPPALANPGVLIKGIKVGGGLMGHKLAHENEAPFPEKLAEWFLRGWCPAGGMVLDPFSGSGTTAAAATKLGMRGIGCDLRLSQCELGRKRCADVQMEMF